MKKKKFNEENLNKVVVISSSTTEDSKIYNYEDVNYFLQKIQVIL